MRHTRLLLGMCFALLLSLPGVLPAQAAPPTQAEPRSRCFEATGYCIEGAFLDYWEQHGGLAVFGYPISEQRTEVIEADWTGPVQWFERDRLEDHGIDGIQAGRLGAILLERQGHEWWQPAHQEAPREPACVYMATTGYNLCEPFLSYWEQHGGVERFGYPLTAAHTASVGDWTGPVQYFERRRMEYHRTPAGDGAVLLGHLGKELLHQPGVATICTASVAEELQPTFAVLPFKRQLGCPGTVYHDVPAAWQPFERGRMLWADLGDAGGQVYVLSTLPWLVQQVVVDSWQPAPEPNTPTPPAAHLQAPRERLGKVWREQEGVAHTIGWATGAQQPERATVQRFDQGWLLWLHQADMVAAFGATPDALALVPRPDLRATADGTPVIAGQPAPTLGGELVVRTRSVDFYRLPGGLSHAEIVALSGAVEQSITSGTTMVGTPLHGRVALRFEPRQTGPCAIRGLTLSNQRTIRMFYEPGYNLRRIEAILAHEFIHQLQHDYYGAADHLRSDIILLEGMAMWGSSPYYQASSGEPAYHANVRQALQEGTLLSLTTSLEADCRTTTRNTIYDQWASFVEYLLLTYGRDRFDALYAQSTGRPAGSASYEAVYDKSLADLEAEWLTWLANQP